MKPDAAPQAPIMVVGHLASKIRWHMWQARVHQEAGGLCENLDIAARHFRREDEHLKAILVLLEFADAASRQPVEVV